jgi:hypothetical protein
VTVQSRLLERARTESGLSVADLWLRCFALGSMSTPVELEAHLEGALMPSPHEYDILAHALNERFVELGSDHPVPYTET